MDKESKTKTILKFSCTSVLVSKLEVIYLLKKMEEVATPPKDQSSDSIATSEEFEDLGSSSANKNGEISNQQEIKDVHSGVITDEVVPPKENKQPSPEIEIGNNGNLADLQVTLDEALNDETQNSNGNLTISFCFFQQFSLCLMTVFRTGSLKSNDSDSQSCAVFNRISYLGSATVCIFGSQLYWLTLKYL